MHDPIVTFERVTKSYDGRTLVVEALDLTLARGEFLTLLGPSGSGKTTTLMMLAGFEDPTSGTITLDGKRLNHVPAHRRGIGMVFQNYALFPHMTVAENLVFPLEMHGVPKAEIEPKVKRALDMVRLPQLRDRKPGQLSGGQQQRVAVARALVYGPKLVLMDEPLGALDKQLREELQLEIKHLHDELGVTIVYVTHDQSEALTMSDRIAVFHQGRVQQLATPADLYERPANAFVASFIGENNRFDGTLVGRDGANCRVRLPDGSEIAATIEADLAPGAAVAVSIRPERVAVGAQAQRDNRFVGDLREVIYLGDHCKLRLAVAGNESFVVKVAAGDAATTLDRGSALAVAWDAAACRALPPLA
ncbi:MAG: ABC transporter ATP-binding protein [Burkholderiales bacterium]|nr:ABC transporter ATP-binding protein [Burkholderiales bacterium]